MPAQVLFSSLLPPKHPHPSPLPSDGRGGFPVPAFEYSFNPSREHRVRHLILDFGRKLAYSLPSMEQLLVSTPLDLNAFGGVIFDLDGTLLDTLADIANAADSVLAQHGFLPHPV